MAIRVSDQEYNEWTAAGLASASTQGNRLADWGRYGVSMQGTVLVDDNKAAEIRAKLKELKSNVSAQSSPEVQDKRRSTQSMLGGDFSAYSLLSSNKKGNTLLG